MIRLRVGMAGALLVTLAASGCGVVGGGGDAGSMRSMLEQVPDTADSRTYLRYGNLARLRGDAEPAKDEDSEIEALGNAARAKGGAVVFAEPMGAGIFSEWKKEAGFGIRNLDASIQAGYEPGNLSVFEGRFDTAAIDKAYTNTKETKASERSGVTTYSMGKEGEHNMDALSALRTTGEALRVGASDNRLWFAPTDRVLDSMLDLADGHGGAKSLADDKHFAAIAEAFDEAEAFDAFVIGDPRRFNAGGDGGGLAPWQVAAVADASGELVLVLVHADQATAEQNEARLRTVVGAMSNLLSVTSTKVDGDVLVAHLKSEKAMAYTFSTPEGKLLPIGYK